LAFDHRKILRLALKRMFGEGEIQRRRAAQKKK
jgi:hypothetical protein